MIYGKMKIALRYFLNFRFVRVTRYAKTPPYNIAPKHAKILISTELISGVHKYIDATLRVTRSRPTRVVIFAVNKFSQLYVVRVVPSASTCDPVALACESMLPG